MATRASDKEWEVVVTRVVEDRYKTTAPTSHEAAMNLGAKVRDTDTNGNPKQADSSVTVSTKIGRAARVAVEDAEAGESIAAPRAGAGG